MKKEKNLAKKVSLWFSLTTVISGMVMSNGFSVANAAGATFAGAKLNAKQKNTANKYVKSHAVTEILALQSSVFEKIAAKNTNVASPYTNKDYTVNDLFDRDVPMADEIGILATIITNDIVDGKYDFASMAVNLDLLGDMITVITDDGSGTPGESYGGSSDECVGGGCTGNNGGVGNNCGNWCEDAKGSECGTVCGGDEGVTCGVSCPNKPRDLTQDLSIPLDEIIRITGDPTTMQEEFFNSYFNNMNGASLFTSVLVDRYKAEIMAEVANELTNR